MNTYCRVSLLVGLLSVAPICGFPRSVKAAPASRSAAAGDPSLYGRHPDESWTTPSLSGTRLKAQTPLVAHKDDRPTFTREMIPGGWRPFDSFQVYVIKPKGVVRPPVVLYLYDYNNDTARFMKDGYCERITRSGCAAIGFESALSAGRFKMRPMRQWFVSELPESLSDSAHDV